MKYLSLSLFVLLLVSCEALSSEDRKIAGNIYLINPHNQFDTGYSLVYHDKFGVNENLLNEYVKELYGDDSLLLVLCEKEGSHEELFFSVKHANGLEPVNVSPIAQSEYVQNKNKIKIKYSFRQRN